MEVKPFLKKFTGETKKFYCKGEEHTFTISLGFAESVSYTHLDVYKRQRLRRLRRAALREDVTKMPQALSYAAW